MGLIKKVIPIYNYSVYIAIEDDDPNMYNDFDHFPDDFFSSYACVWRRVWRNKKTLKSTLMIRFSSIDAAKDASTVAHESFHAAMIICYDVGIKVEPSNNEAAAYLIGYIVGLVNDYVKLYI